SRSPTSTRISSPRTSPSGSRPRCSTPGTSRSSSSARRAPSRSQSDARRSRAHEMTKPLTVICVGDVFGEPGRKAVHARLPGLRKQHEADLAIVNVENAASGFGVTPLIARGFLEHGVDVMTSGNHIWDKKEIIEYIGKENLLLRPANFPVGTPGVGH